MSDLAALGAVDDAVADVANGKRLAQRVTQLSATLQDTDGQTDGRQ